MYLYFLLTLSGFGNIRASQRGRRNTVSCRSQKDGSLICQAQTILLLYPFARKKFILVSVTFISSICRQLVILFYKKFLMGICCTAIYLVRNVIFFPVQFCTTNLSSFVRTACKPWIPSFYTKKSFCCVNLCYRYSFTEEERLIS